MPRLNDRSVFGDLNARNELEIIDNIYDRAIITTNSANILNIMSESSALNPDEEVIRKRGRKKTPKVCHLPLRRSPRKTSNNSNTNLLAIESQSSTQSDQTHDYFLRTPKKTPIKSMSRTPSKRMTPSKSAPMTPRRVSPRKRLQLDGNDSGIGLTPSPHVLTPEVGTSNQKSVPKTNSNKSSIISRRRRRRYF